MPTRGSLQTRTRSTAIVVAGIWGHVFGTTVPHPLGKNVTASNGLAMTFAPAAVPLDVELSFDCDLRGPPAFGGPFWLRVCAKAVDPVCSRKCTLSGRARFARLFC